VHGELLDRTLETSGLAASANSHAAFARRSGDGGLRPGCARIRSRALIARSWLRLSDRLRQLARGPRIGALNGRGQCLGTIRIAPARLGNGVVWHSCAGWPNTNAEGPALHTCSTLLCVGLLAASGPAATRSRPFLMAALRDAARCGLQGRRPGNNLARGGDGISATDGEGNCARQYISANPAIVRRHLAGGRAACQNGRHERAARGILARRRDGAPVGRYTHWLVPRF